MLVQVEQDDLLWRHDADLCKSSVANKAWARTTCNSNELKGASSIRFRGEICLVSCSYSTILAIFVAIPTIFRYNVGTPTKCFATGGRSVTDSLDRSLIKVSLILLTGAMAALLDTTMVSVALAQLADEFGARSANCSSSRPLTC